MLVGSGARGRASPGLEDSATSSGPCGRQCAEGDGERPLPL
jgi:hypothetical protein